MEPDRQIEKLLRTAAERRRKEAGGGFPLHPATRRLLQGEVTRVYGPAGGAERPEHTANWLLRIRPFLPRLAWASSLVVLLGVVTWLALPDRRTADFSLAKSAEAARRLEPAATVDREDMAAPPAPTMAEVPPPTAPAFEPTKSKDSLLADAAVPGAGAPATASGGNTLLATRDALTKSSSAVSDEALAFTNAPLATVASESDTQARRYGLAFETRSAPPKAVPAPTAARGSLAAGTEVPQPMSTETAAMSAAAAPRASEGLDKDSINFFANTQRFTQSTAANTARFARNSTPAVAPPMPTVLNNFDVSQAGTELRITDEDGSIYSGYLEDPGVAQESLLARQRATTGRAEAPATISGAGGSRPSPLLPQPGRQTREGSPALGIPAQGANQQAYFFKVVGTNRSLNEKVVFTGNVLAEETSRPRQVPWQVQNARITGTALVGEKRQVQVDAQSVSPGNLQQKP